MTSLDKTILDMIEVDSQVAKTLGKILDRVERVEGQVTTLAWVVAAIGFSVGIVGLAAIWSAVR